MYVYDAESLPKDPAMLLSLLNMKLRDEYSSLEEICESLGTDAPQLEKRLSAIGYTYDAEQNQFR